MGLLLVPGLIETVPGLLPLPLGIAPRGCRSTQKHPPGIELKLQGSEVQDGADAGRVIARHAQSPYHVPVL